MTEAFHTSRISRRGTRVVSAILLLLPVFTVIVAGGSPEWQALAPGMELKYVTPQASESSNSAITILRLDPKQWELVVLGTSQTGETAGHTAREWCAKGKF